MHFKRTITLIYLSLFFCAVGPAQILRPVKDSTINNLIHTPGYKTGEYGAIPAYSKSGKGRQKLILIPGLGFDASVFNDFIKANKNNYTMYSITIPGYGNTMAPPMPLEGTSYGEQSWNKGVIEGLVKLIAKEKIQKPVIVGDFVQGTQLALRMAIDQPGKVAGVIILGGPAKFIVMGQGDPKKFTLKGYITFTDNYTAPKWFKTIRKEDFDNGNYLPEIYSLDSTQGIQLWKQVASVPLPVMVRYLCEFFASDITPELDKIKCPVLVLRPLYNENVLDRPINNYVRPQFINSWNDAATKNPLIKIKDIDGAGSFLWKDKPRETYEEIKDFLNKH